MPFFYAKNPDFLRPFEFMTLWANFRAFEGHTHLARWPYVVNVWFKAFNIHNL